MKANSSNRGQFPGVENANETPMQQKHLLLFGHEIQRTTVLIALMFVVGAGWVLWESHSVRPKTAVAAAEDPNITMNLDQMRLEGAIGKARDARKDQVFGPLLHDVQRREIHLNPLNRSPFGETAKKEKPKEETAQVVKAVVEETPPELGALDLQSILIGASPTAIINGVLVQEGQFVNDWKVVEIQPQKVVLQWRTRQHVLTMP